MTKSSKQEIEFPKGLEGVVAATTQVGSVDGTAGKLAYRGYDVNTLAEHSTYEETAYLLLYGSLPTRSELAGFHDKLLGYRTVPDEALKRLSDLPCPCHPMSMLRSGISLLECIDDACRIAETQESKRDAGIQLIAQMATLTGAISRTLEQKPPIAPDPALSHAGNFLYMLSGKRPERLAERVMDIALILHADHGMNASTFASMVVASTLSDIHSAVSTGIATLKGSLHGGANERVIRLLEQFSTPDEALVYVDKAMANKEKIVGFGHRVYKTYDPRARIFQRYARDLSELTGDMKLFNIAEAIEKKVVEKLGSKGILPNVDFYSGIIYHALGIDASIFTPIFAVSRVAGWVARIMEYLEDNRLFRPRAIYVGPENLAYTPMDERE
jgi:citrate synthase